MNHGARLFEIENELMKGRPSFPITVRAEKGVAPRSLQHGVLSRYSRTVFSRTREGLDCWDPDFERRYTSVRVEEEEPWRSRK